MAKKISLSDLDLAADAKSLKAALEKADTNKVRDPYILFDWDDAEGKNFKAGYAVLYPGCRTGGHEHDDVEEVYHVVNGKGNMYVGDESFAFEPGDTWIVPRFKHHWTENTGNRPIEMFWILIKV